MAEKRKGGKTPHNTARTFGQRIHTAIFREAKIYHAGAGFVGDMLVDAVRDDIVVFGVSTKGSISKLTVAQKVDLCNAYRLAVGESKKYFVPAKYDPAKRKASRKKGGATPNPNALPSPEQRAELQRLFDRCGFPKNGPAREDFLFGQCGFRTPPTRNVIGKALTILKSMDKRQFRYGAGSARAK